MNPKPPPTTIYQSTVMPRTDHPFSGSRSRSSTVSSAGSPLAASRLLSGTAEPGPSTIEPISMNFDTSTSSRSPRDKRRRSSTASLEGQHLEDGGAVEDGVPAKRRRLSNDARPSAPAFLSDFNRADRFQEFQEGSSRARPLSYSFEELDGAIDVDALTDTASPPPQSLRYTDGSFLSQNSFTEEELHPITSTPQPPTPPPPPPPVRPKVEPLSPYNCPICFSPPTHATLTPCGHVCCGDCLFAAVKSSIERAAYHGPIAQAARYVVSSITIILPGPKSSASPTSWLNERLLLYLFQCADFVTWVIDVRSAELTSLDGMVKAEA